VALKNDKHTYKELVVIIRNIIESSREYGDSDERAVDSILDLFKESEIWIECQDERRSQ
jgi:hypothetical protein